MDMNISSAEVTLFGIIITLLLQLGVGIWWAATINSNVKHLSNALSKLNTDSAIRHDRQEKSLDAVWNKHDSLEKRVTVIEVNCENRHKE